MPTYYHNETLFSEIYLEEITRLPEQADALAYLNALREYRDYANTASLPAWKESYVHEVLSALGFTIQPQNGPVTGLAPIGAAAGQPIALGFILLPGENLDNTLIGRNWMEKTIRALRNQGLHWGLLTNGRQWRIVHADEPTPYETYLEIDLESILGDQAKPAYQIFHKFLKAENFTTGVDGKCQFDRFKKESQDKIDYIEKELANALRQREEGGKGVLSDLCMGYVEELRRRHEGDLDDEALRKKIYHGAMLYMFRLLFLLYADARRLLSDGNHVALERLETDCRARRAGAAGQAGTLQLWDSLEQIFVDIDQTYNGGLFSPQESEFTRFLSDTRIADNYLANVIFNLTTYREKNGQERPVSYRDMSVRHLGTLYEGLLEHRLFIAKEDTEVKIAKGLIQFIPASQGGKLVVGHFLPAGSVYFAGDASERKSTGSYYTPEYIVDYIVRNTVGEKLEELKQTFLTEEQTNLDALKRAIDDSERGALADLLEQNAMEFVRQKVLQISVLDPAMGSGHFLVNAVNLIANFITELINELGIEGTLSSETADWRRWVVEDCIYGVDINPLAVELAKLSLWILSMAKDHPLSFLNHNLKCGNSLVGARLDEIGNYPFLTLKKEPHQLSLFERDPDFKFAVGEAVSKSHLITSRSSTSLENVKEKKAWLEDIEQALKGYKAICNIHTGLYFGNLVDEKQYIDLVEKRDFVRSYEIEKPNQYFHWELEFPQILLDLDIHDWGKISGFDVIIGNPPYIATELLSLSERNYISQEYPIASGKYDLSVVFLGKCADLLTLHGQLGMIVPTTWETGENYSPFRKNYFASKVLGPSIVINLPFNVFPGAYIDTCLAIFRKPAKENFYVYAYPKNEKIEWINIEEKLISVSQKLIFKDLTHRIFMSASHYSFLEKFRKPIFHLLSEITDSCQGPVESFYEYTQNPELDSDLPYYSCAVSRYDIEVLGTRFIRFGAKNSLSRFYTQPRILIRRIVNRDNRLMATAVNESFIVRKDLNPFILKDGSYNLLYILTIMNSALISHLYLNSTTTAGKDDFRQTTLSSLGSLPIRKIYFTTPQKARSIEFDNAQLLYSKGKIDDLMALVQTWFTDNLEKSDIAYYLLVFLAEQMIEMNQKCHREEKIFLSWLQEELGIDVDKLTGKTIIQGFLGDYQSGKPCIAVEEILSVLHKNQKIISVSVGDFSFHRRLEEKYQSCLTILIPIKECLKLTDQLINQIIYKLYGLTDEEIVIIEAKG